MYELCCFVVAVVLVVVVVVVVVGIAVFLLLLLLLILLLLFLFLPLYLVPETLLQSMVKIRSVDFYDRCPLGRGRHRVKILID